jgi:hypothetical protein
MPGLCGVYPFPRGGGVPQISGRPGTSHKADGPASSGWGAITVCKDSILPGVFICVTQLYSAGRLAEPKLPPIYGQLRSGVVKRVDVLYLWPGDWIENVENRWRPLALLWHPQVRAFQHSSFCALGFELDHGPSARRWCAQKWVCELSSYAEVRSRARAHLGLPEAR